MNEYVKQAKDFLKSCNATMEIKYVGDETPNWDDRPHRTYDCTIKTPRGEMFVHFHDSRYNTELHMFKTVQEYAQKRRRIYDLQPYTTFYNKIAKEFKEKKAEAVPTEYDILACIQKYDIGSMDDFFAEFGFEIKCTQDMTNFINTYNAVVKEYNDVRRCFTEEQIEQLCEIN